MLTRVFSPACWSQTDRGEVTRRNLRQPTSMWTRSKNQLTRRALCFALLCFCLALLCTNDRSAPEGSVFYTRQDASWQKSKVSRSHDRRSGVGICVQFVCMPVRHLPERAWFVRVRGHHNNKKKKKKNLFIIVTSNFIFFLFYLFPLFFFFFFLIIIESTNKKKTNPLGKIPKKKKKKKKKKCIYECYVKVYLVIILVMSCVYIFFVSNYMRVVQFILFDCRQFCNAMQKT